MSTITDRMCANHSSDLQILRLQLMKRGFWSTANQLEFFRETNLNISNTNTNFFVKIQFNVNVHVLKYCESNHVLKARGYEIIRVSYFIEKVSGNFLKCGFTFISLTCKIKFLAIRQDTMTKTFQVFNFSLDLKFIEYVLLAKFCNLHLIATFTWFHKIP